MLHVIQVTGASADSVQYADVLARLRREYADEDRVDPHSTLERLPTAEDLLLAFVMRTLGWSRMQLPTTWLATARCRAGSKTMAPRFTC